MSPAQEHQGQVVANEAGDPLGLIALSDAVEEAIPTEREIWRWGAEEADVLTQVGGAARGASAGLLDPVKPGDYPGSMEAKI
jgi:hypothetical protein